GLDRSSVWFYNAERDAIIRHDLYEAGARQHSQGTTLHARDFPAYFEALRSEEVITAEDAHTDPRTAQFSKPYLSPVGIGAMLDAPIRVGGAFVGVLCNEHIGGARKFTTDEQNAASYLANLVSLAYEIQRRARSEHEAKRSLSLLRAAFEASGAGILAVDATGKVTAHNELLLELWGISRETLAESDRAQRVHHMASNAKDPAAVESRIMQVYTDPECDSLDTFELKDGRYLEITSQPQRLDDEVIGRVWSFRDVSYQRSIEKELRELSIRDALTGLFNRRCAEETLLAEMHRAQRTKQPFSVAMLDIDHFKQVNDVHGHQVGDDVLRQLAVDMREQLRKTDVACRWGGEEFLVILPYTGIEGARHAIDKLRVYLARERESLPHFTVSAGVAEYDGGERPDTMIATADERLYEAKQTGRHRVC
ncbi:MAG: diguanylate cyclase, partial [Gammaproteobacteria bacterium]